MELGYFQNLHKPESSEKLDRTSWKKTGKVIQLGMCPTNQFKLAVVAAVNQIAPEFRLTIFKQNVIRGACVHN